MGNIERIIYPGQSEVTVESNIDWIYIMRKDAAFTMTSLAERIGASSDLSKLLSSYNLFCDNLFRTLIAAYSGKGNAYLHLYEAEDLEEKIGAEIQDKVAVSLDPLIDINSFKVSRGYYLGGMVDHGQVNRPGADTLNNQAAHLASILGLAHLTVIEDDVFSGGSLLSALSHLTNHGLLATRIIPGIQIGLPQKILDQGINVSPVVKYQPGGAFDIFDKVDLGDPRDFLLGVSGLVVKLPSGQYGRLPYILPFVSTSARASLPKPQEKQFGLNALDMAVDFYGSAKTALDLDIKLVHVDPYFSLAMQELFGFKPQASMLDIASWAKDNMDEIWQMIKQKGEAQHD